MNSRGGPASLTLIYVILMLYSLHLILMYIAEKAVPSHTYGCWNSFLTLDRALDVLKKNISTY